MKTVLQRALWSILCLTTVLWLVGIETSARNHPESFNPFAVVSSREKGRSFPGRHRIKSDRRRLPGKNGKGGHDDANAKTDDPYSDDSAKGSDDSAKGSDDYTTGGDGQSKGDDYSDGGKGGKGKGSDLKGKGHGKGAGPKGMSDKGGDDYTKGDDHYAKGDDYSSGGRGKKGKGNTDKGKGCGKGAWPKGMMGDCGKGGPYGKGSMSKADEGKGNCKSGNSKKGMMMGMMSSEGNGYGTDDCQQGGNDDQGGGGNGDLADLCVNYTFADTSGNLVSGRLLQAVNNNTTDNVFERSSPGGPAPSCSPNVFDIAEHQPDLSVWTHLVHVAGLQDIFKCPGPFTILAPDNDAFHQDPQLMYYLLNPANRNDLRNFILYQIIPWRLMSNQFQSGPYQTLEGQQVMVAVNPLTFNGVGVVRPDIGSCNGVIQVIEHTLTPPESGPPSVVPAPQSTNAPTKAIPPPNTQVPTSSPTASPIQSATTVPTPIGSPPSPPSGTSLPTQATTVSPRPIARTTTSPTARVTTVAPIPQTTQSPTTISGTISPFPTPGVTLPNSQSPTFAQTPPPGPITARVTDYYMVYNTPGATTEPTPEQYQQLLNVTQEYYDMVFTANWSNSPDTFYLYTNFSIEETRFNTGYPDPRFNIYVHFNTTVTFAQGSVIPSPGQLLQVMIDAVVSEYITDFVWTVTPFQSTMEVVLKAIDTGAASPNASSPTTPVPMSPTASSPSTSPTTIFPSASARPTTIAGQQNSTRSGIVSVSNSAGSTSSSGSKSAKLVVMGGAVSILLMGITLVLYYRRKMLSPKGGLLTEQSSSVQKAHPPIVFLGPERSKV